LLPRFTAPPALRDFKRVCRQLGILDPDEGLIRVPQRDRKNRRGKHGTAESVLRIWRQDHHCEAWIYKMIAFGGPGQPSPTIVEAIAGRVLQS